MGQRPEAKGQKPEAKGQSPEAKGQSPEELRGVDLTLEELRAWGEAFGARRNAGDIIALEGELGAGKTTLAQAICRGVGIEEDVTSPTFALVNQHEGKRGTVYHLDLYRLNGPDDLTNLGWDDIVNSDAIVIVEWPERAGHRLPDDGIRIRLEYIEHDDNRRRLTLL
jgi:tRNA threonylcarbamoyladenosine biosynthesis protein TsaE